jgi:hypothetical protein
MFQDESAHIFIHSNGHLKLVLWFQGFQGPLLYTYMSDGTSSQWCITSQPTFLVLPPQDAT